MARYARRLDYHQVLRQALEELAHFIATCSGAEIAWRAATDSAPLLERPLAERSGLAWIGKNTLALRPDLGSYFFLAELLLDLPLELPALTPHPDRCGRCTRCLDACPTQAIASPYLLDARRCISTWTIESSGPIPRWIRPHIGDMLFGCDICQEVCPWNRRPDPLISPHFLAEHAAAPTLSLTALDLLEMTSRQINRLFEGSALRRAGRSGLARNAAVVLGNTRPDGALARLIARLALEPVALVRGHIAWALSRFDMPEAAGALLRALDTEPSPYVREELIAALDAIRSGD